MKTFRRAISVVIFGSTLLFAKAPPSLPDLNQIPNLQSSSNTANSNQEDGKKRIRIGMARHQDSDYEQNVLVLVGSYCGWKSASYNNGVFSATTRGFDSADNSESTPANEHQQQSRKTYNYQNPQGFLKGKKKGCTPELQKAVHNTLETILNIYLHTFRYRRVVMIEFGIRTHLITDYFFDPQTLQLSKSENRIEAIQLVEMETTEVDLLEDLLVEIATTLVKHAGTLDVYMHLHSSPTDFYINDTPFKISHVWDRLLSERIRLTRTHWYFDTCQAGRVQEFVKDDTKEGHQLLVRLADQWLVAVSSFQNEHSHWIVPRTRWGTGQMVSVYALAIQRAVNSLIGTERIMDLFHTISDTGPRILQEHNLYFQRQNPGFTVFDTDFAKSPVFQDFFIGVNR